MSMINGKFEHTFIHNPSTGLASKRNKMAELLPTAEVENEVVLLNPAFEGHLPFHLQPGQKAELAQFLTPEQKKAIKLVDK